VVAWLLASVGHPGGFVPERDVLVRRPDSEIRDGPRAEAQLYRGGPSSLETEWFAETAAFKGWVPRLSAQVWWLCSYSGL